MDYTDLYNFQTDTGIVVPSDKEILEGVQTKFQQIFGTDLDYSSETPVGRLIEAFAVLIKTSLGVTAQSANQFNIDLSTGIYLDSLATIYNLERISGSKTRIAVSCYFNSMMAPGVPAGAEIISSTTGATFKLDAAVLPSETVIKEDGTEQFIGYGTATATEVGPIPGEVGTVNIVGNSVLGWIGVNNTSVLALGINQETDEEFRKRIKKARSIGIGFLDSLTSRLSRIDEVYSVCILENNNTDTELVNGIKMPGHSIFICVYTGGGDPSDKVQKEIAEAIVATKPVGTGIVDSLDRIEIGGAVPHTYIMNVMGDIRYGTAITFYTPELVELKVHIKIFTGLYTGTDVVSAIKTAVQNYVSSVDIGKTAYTTEMSSAIIKAVSGVNVLSIAMSIGEDEYDESGDFGPDRVVSFAFQKLIASVDDIYVEVV